MTGGVHPHAGTFAAGPEGTALDDDRRPGQPVLHHPGRLSWRSKAVLGAPCLSEVPFQELETLYHSRYHQEIPFPRESPPPAEPQD